MGIVIKLSTPHPVKIDLNKKLDPKQKTFQTFNVDALGFRKWKSSNVGCRSYQLTSTSQSAHGWQISWDWIAGNSYFLLQMIFIFCFSQPLGINIEGLNSLLLGIKLFIEIYSYRLWYMVFCTAKYNPMGHPEMCGPFLLLI